MSLTGKHVTVTGAGGFIGSHLVERLAREGARVKALVHYNSRGLWGHLGSSAQEVADEVEVVMGDIRDGAFVDALISGSDVVFHLAALIGIPYSYIAPRSYIETNVVGTLNVLEACRRHDVERMVHTSTSETYGTAVYTPIDERHPLCGQSPYAASKIGADKLVESYFLSFEVPAATIRPFNNFGPRQSARALIPTIISQALTQRCVELGSLEPIRDYVYVEDTVDAFLEIASATESVGKVINIGSGKASSVEDIAKRILRIMRSEAEIRCSQRRMRPTGSEVLELRADVSAATSLLGWEPSWSFDDGLRQTIEWISEHIDEFRTKDYIV